MRPRARNGRTTNGVLACLVTGGLLLAASPSTASPAFTWSPVQTVWSGKPGTVESVTMTNGTVIAAWNGKSFNNIFVAARPLGGTWQPPTKIRTTAAAFDLAQVDKGAWLICQGFEQVSVVHISNDGAVGSVSDIGPSSDPFSGSPHIAAGSNGDVAATWETSDQPNTNLAYLPKGGGWSTPEQVPQPGTVDGLVVNGAGDAQVILQTANPDAQHLQLAYVSRTPQGVWGSPFVVAATAYLPTVEGNAEGDIVVGWEIVNGNGTFTLAARYKAADGSFDATHHLDESVPANSFVSLGMASDGSLIAVYRIADSGDNQIQLTPADSTGTWLNPQTLSMTGGTYAVSVTKAGEFAIMSQQGSGVQVTTCYATYVCQTPGTNPAPGFTIPVMSYQRGLVNLVWGKGCKGEECQPTKVVAQRGRP